MADPARSGAPLGWDLPDGLGVQWANAPSGHGRAIRMDTRVSEIADERPLDAGRPHERLVHSACSRQCHRRNLRAELLFRSRLPVASGVTYRVSADVWGACGRQDLGARLRICFAGSMTRRYETVLNCYGSGEAWRTCAQEFNPTRHRPEVAEMRVMLFAYYPAGLYWFDNVRVEVVGRQTEP
jgi:hypothetical protein